MQNTSCLLHFQCVFIQSFGALSNKQVLKMKVKSIKSEVWVQTDDWWCLYLFHRGTSDPGREWRLQAKWTLFPPTMRVQTQLQRHGEEPVPKHRRWSMIFQSLPLCWCGALSWTPLAINKTQPTSGGLWGAASFPPPPASNGSWRQPGLL